MDNAIRVVDFRTVKHLWDMRSQTWLEPNYVYIGRENATYNLPRSKWANPYKLKNDNNDRERRKVIDEFRRYLRCNVGLLLDIRELQGKTLVCWCHPRACHGHVLAKAAMMPDDVRQNVLEWAGISGGIPANFDPLPEMPSVGDPVADGLRPGGADKPAQLSLF